MGLGKIETFTNCVPCKWLRVETADWWKRYPAKALEPVEHAMLTRWAEHCFHVANPREVSDPKTSFRIPFLD
jgi:hypothetical protein